MKLPGDKLQEIRRNLTLLVDTLRVDPNTADPHRLSTVLETANGLIQYIDDYPLE